MNVRAIGFVLVLSCLPAAGCGTVANLARSRPEEGGRIPFGGVKHDLSCIQKAASNDFGARADSEPERYPQVALMLLGAVDLPFSFVGDVVSWPYTASFTFINQPFPVDSVLQVQTPSVPIAPAPEPLAVGPPSTPLAEPRKLP